LKKDDGFDITEKLIDINDVLWEADRKNIFEITDFISSVTT